MKCDINHIDLNRCIPVISRNTTHIQTWLLYVMLPRILEPTINLKHQTIYMLDRLGYQSPSSIFIFCTSSPSLLTLMMTDQITILGWPTYRKHLTSNGNVSELTLTSLVIYQKTTCPRSDYCKTIDSDELHLRFKMTTDNMISAFNICNVITFWAANVN